MDNPMYTQDNGGCGSNNMAPRDGNTISFSPECRRVDSRGNQAVLHSLCSSSLSKHSLSKLLKHSLMKCKNLMIGSIKMNVTNDGCRETERRSSYHTLTLRMKIKLTLKKYIVFTPIFWLLRENCPVLKYKEFSTSLSKVISK